MTTSQRKGSGIGLAALGAGMLMALAPAAAQVPAPVPERSDDALSRNLRSLSQNPKSIQALMGAGRAALELGDPQAAITFFARAEEQAPRDGRIKMWIGAALVQLEQPRSALKFFKDAVDLGVSEREIAKERGLAHDISGEPRLAQADYRLALQQGRDAEVTRRLALSLAISGEREAALRLLEDQLLMRDVAAERSRALILGLTGDAAGAERALHATMPAPQATAMAPFLAQLPALNLSERAAAVHLGHFPGDGRSRPVPPTAYASASPTQAGRPDSGQPPLARRNPSPASVSTAPRRRPGTETASVSSSRADSPAPSKRVQRRGTPPESAWSWARGTPPSRSVARQPERSAKASTPPPQVETRRVERQVRAAPTPATALASASPPPPQPETPKQLPSERPTQTAAIIPTTNASSQPAPSSDAAEPPGQSVVAAASPAAPSSEAKRPAQMAEVTPAPTGALSKPAPGPSDTTAPIQIATAGIAQSPLESIDIQPGFSINPAASAPNPAAPAPQNVPAAPAPEQSRPIQIAELQPSQVPASAPPESGSPIETAPIAVSPRSEQISGINRLADVAAAIAELPDPEPPVAAPLRPRSAAKAAETPKREERSRTASTPTVKKTAPAAPKEPSRHWVQVAGGANKAAFARTFAGLKAKAPKLLGSRTAWTAPLNATNRLLVGPFPSSKEAQAFVNELAKSDLSAFAWTSEAGEKIDRLPAK